MLLAWGFASCDNLTNFLEKPPGVDITEDTIFSTKNNLETFVAGAYYYNIMNDMPHWDDRDKSDCLTAAATDECEIYPSWFWVQGAWNSAGMRPGDTGDRRFQTHWIGLRRVNIILERIDDAPFNDPAYKKQVRGEAKFMRAFTNFELFRKYGGIPLLFTRLGPADDLLIPRSTVKITVDSIIRDCNEAIIDVESTHPPELRGRVNKAAVAALKSRVLLYAASPTFNTDKPYLSLGEHNDLICYGNYDRERWKLAADAAKAAIDEATRAGFRLIDEYGSDENYQYVWETHDNAEIILAEKSKGTRGTGHFPWGYFFPGQGYWVTHNFTKLYETKQGTPAPWKDEGGDDLMEIYDNLDPRYRQTMVTHNGYYNKDYPQLDISTTGQQLPKGAGCEGPLLHKPMPYIVASGVSAIPNSIIFRMAELYLNYAEALNEYASTPPDEAYEAVDLIRARSGMPKLPRGLSQAQFRNRVRNERAVELAFEGHRLFDIRRWEIADEGIMKGAMYGIHIYKAGSACSYVPYIFETRSFKQAMYRHPFPQGEINKEYLIQNPGY
jgi:hypothetical protein